MDGEALTCSQEAACGPLALKLMQRGLEIGRSARSTSELVDRLYHTVLLPAQPGGAPPPIEANAPLPAVEGPLEDSEDHYSSVFLAEQMPLAIAALVFGRGDPRVAIPTACMLGRDADTTATTVGSWAGALAGEAGLPADWVERVRRVNLGHIDIRALAEALVDLPE